MILKKQLQLQAKLDIKCPAKSIAFKCIVKVLLLYKKAICYQPTLLENIFLLTVYVESPEDDNGSQSSLEGSINPEVNLLTEDSSVTDSASDVSSVNSTEELPVTASYWEPET